MFIFSQCFCKTELLTPKFIDENNLDKEKYTVGEEVFIKIPNAKKGKALVSIENGSKIIHHFWHDMANGDVIKFKTNEEMSPNAFVSIHLIQNYASKKNRYYCRTQWCRKNLVNKNYKPNYFTR